MMLIRQDCSEESVNCYFDVWIEKIHTDIRKSDCCIWKKWIGKTRFVRSSKQNLVERNMTGAFNQ